MDSSDRKIVFANCRDIIYTNVTHTNRFGDRPK